MRDLAAIALLFACGAAACTKEETPRLGPYDGLVGVSPGDAAALTELTEDAAVTAPVDATVAVVDANEPIDAPAPAVDANEASTTCGDPACTVSWQNDIWTKMTTLTTAQGWGCSGGSCHAGGSTMPEIGVSAQVDYKTLSKFTSNDFIGLTYIKPCDTNPADSAFVCNTDTTTCGPRMPNGAILSISDEQMIKTWVACGSPEN